MVLAFSSWTWIVVTAFGLVTIGFLIRATLGLIGRVKDLNRKLRAASGELNEALEAMRADLDQTNEGLAEMRRQGDKG